MSKNLLLEEIKTELERIENLIDSGQLDDMRRSRIANHGDELQDLRKRIEEGNDEEDEFRKSLNNLKSSLKNI